MSIKCTRCFLVLVLMSVAAATLFGQVAPPVARYTATTANTSGSGEAIRIDILRWSTDMERDNIFNAISSGDNGLPPVLQRAASVGYVWTSETAGYALKYAYRIAAADGSERIILITDRTLGTFEPQRWKLTGSASAVTYPFSVIELRIGKTASGEGKASIAAKIVADKTAKTIALDNYAGAPVIFQGVKK
jgi:hypothetical protein